MIRLSARFHVTIIVVYTIKGVYSFQSLKDLLSIVEVIHNGGQYQ